jgi:hypothetical protein
MIAIHSMSSRSNSVWSLSFKEVNLKPERRLEILFEPRNIIATIFSCSSDSWLVSRISEARLIFANDVLNSKVISLIKFSIGPAFFF